MKNEERIYGMSVPVPACEFETRKKWKKNFRLPATSMYTLEPDSLFVCSPLSLSSLLLFFVFFSNFTLQPNVGSNDGS